MISLAALERFCAQLRITSKEKGITPLFLYGTQRYLLQEITRLLSEGIHWIYTLKARQQGITTVLLALDLYWLFKFNGMQGTFVVEEDGKLANHRSTLDGFLQSLPTGLKIPTKVHNRKILEFRNRSKLLYQSAGVKVKGQKSTFGQSTGINYCHGTEMSSWADAEAVANFIGSLAETYEKRLYIFESTAKGYNDFHDRWQDAKNSVTKGNIFIGWWRMEPYAVDRDSLIFKMYGEDAPIGEELLWIDQVKDLYDFEIRPEQLAWWRWKLAEDIRDEQLMFQYYPPTEDHAFILSGYRFFDIERLRQVEKRIKNLALPAFYRYQFGPTFEFTELIPCGERTATLTVWEERDPNGYYVVGADPAYGSSYESDRYCAQVFRCYTNRIVQVAEYCHPEGNTYSFAWILAHLCGYYRNEHVPTTLVIEINGPGKTVMDEFFRLQQYPTQSMPRGTQELMNVIAAIQNYLYTRSDSVTGANYNYHWKTTQELKEYVFNLYRDTFDSEKMEIRSAELVEEMRYIQQSSEGIQSATRTVKDDRVVATALAIEGWIKNLLPDLYAVGASWERANLPKDQDAAGSVLGYNLQNYLSAFRRNDEEYQ